MKFNTKTIHAGIEPDPSTGAIMTPIFQTSTYVQSSPGEHQGYAYARSRNPTRTVLEANLAALEGGAKAICFGSGLAATGALLKTLSPGDEVVVTNDLYGGTYRIMTKVYAKYGINFKFINLMDPDSLNSNLTSKTKMVWVETPTNPMLSIIDIKAVADQKSPDIKLVVDNTFATPYLQRPIEHGADYVVHSATKYLGGHSDVVHGAIVTKTIDDAESLYFIQNAEGAVPGPQDCFLVLRGIKTLHLRVQRACENAAAIATFLQGQDKVNNVYYPGLADHPNHAIAARQMYGFGGMVTFDLYDDTAEAAAAVLEKTRYFSLAESLGGVESLIGHPASMTHGSIPRADRLKVGLTDSLIRLSVGVEDVEDLISDLAAALA